MRLPLRKSWRGNFCAGLTSEAFGSLKSDGLEQLQLPVDYSCPRDRGILLYMRQEGRGIGWSNKIRASA
ncbi:MAG: hypothetical protein D6715_12510 [Calditrichaeota bacterium]|nr:MAG: hypothetical protein D6715_12510 [Calditrichota bacterium]